MDLTLLIATYNRVQPLLKLFESLSTATQPKTLDWEILVVDNNSSDDTQSVVKSLTSSTLPAPRYCFESRQGKSFALNTGIEKARGEFIAFLDDDVLVFPDYLLGLAAFIRSDSYNVFGGKILPLWPYDPPAWITKGKPFLNTRGGIVAHDYGGDTKEYMPGMRLPVGANWGCRRRLFQEYGTFKTYLGPQGKNPGGSEDTDIVIRLQEGGETLLYTPQICIYHPVEPERMTRSYFRRRLFMAGRQHLRDSIVQKKQYQTLYGIPLFLYRFASQETWRWTTSLIRGHRSDAYDHLLNIYYAAGSIYEARHTSYLKNSSS